MVNPELPNLIQACRGQYDAPGPIRADRTAKTSLQLHLTPRTRRAWRPADGRRRAAATAPAKQCAAPQDDLPQRGAGSCPIARRASAGAIAAVAARDRNGKLKAHQASRRRDALFRRVRASIVHVSRTKSGPGYRPDIGQSLAALWLSASCIGAPKGNRTPVFAVKGRRPGPLDDGRGAAFRLGRNGRLL